jgi:hypothetical protein
VGYRRRIMSRVFVLSTGRCGSTTFARSCAHIANYTCGHETNWGRLGDVRLDYPDQHIEVDNRLSWFLGSLHRRYPDATYVHLLRDPDLVVASFLKRWPWDPPAGRVGVPRILDRALGRVTSGVVATSILPAFAYQVSGRKQRIPADDRPAVAAHYVQTVTENIEAFLVGRDHRRVDLDSLAEDLPELWAWMGAEGDLGAATGEVTVHHNAS